MAVTDGNIVTGSDVKSILGEAGSSNDTIISLSIRRAENAVIRYLKYDPVQRSRTEFYPLGRSNGLGQGKWDVNETQAFFSLDNSSVGSELQLLHLPVRSTGLQVWVDSTAKAGSASGAFAAATELTEGTDFWVNYDSVDSDGNSVCTDGILRSYGRWPSEPGSIKVTYTAGYSAAEIEGRDSLINGGAIWDAVLEEAMHRCRDAIQKKKSGTLGYTVGPKVEERLGDYSYRVSDALSQQLFGVRSYDLLRSSMVSLEEYVNYGHALLQ